MLWYGRHSNCCGITHYKMAAFAMNLLHAESFEAANNFAPVSCGNLAIYRHPKTLTSLGHFNNRLMGIRERFTTAAASLKHGKKCLGNVGLHLFYSLSLANNTGNIGSISAEAALFFVGACNNQKLMLRR